LKRFLEKIETHRNCSIFCVSDSQSSTEIEIRKKSVQTDTKSYVFCLSYS